MSRQADDLIERKVRETHRYFYNDGLVEIGVGFIFLLTGLVLVGWLLFQGNPVLRIASVLALPVLATLGALLMKRAVTALKERVTYPRTGYVAYREGQPSRGRWLIMAAALILAVSSFFLPELLAKMPIAIGGILAVVLAYLGYRVSLARFYVSASVAFLLGLAGAIFVADELLGAALTFVAAGLTLLIGGAIALLAYLQEHPVRHAEGES
jgi:hypothetical protein